MFLRSVLLISLLLAGGGRAQFFGQSDPLAPCSSSGESNTEGYGSSDTKIAFVNGIFSDLDASRQSAEYFEKTLKSNLTAPTGMSEVGLYWNPGRTGNVVDSMQLLLNKIQEENHLSSPQIKQLANYLIETYLKGRNFPPIDPSKREDLDRLLSYLDRYPEFFKFSEETHKRYNCSGTVLF